MLQKYKNGVEPRYGLQIQFTGQEGNLIRLWDWNVYFKTLEEIEPYKELIDHTVAKAQIVDWEQEKIIERLK